MNAGNGLTKQHKELLSTTKSEIYCCVSDSIVIMWGPQIINFPHIWQINCHVLEWGILNDILDPLIGSKIILVETQIIGYFSRNFELYWPKFLWRFWV